MLSKLLCSIAKALGGCQADKLIAKPTGIKIISFQEKDLFLTQKFPGVKRFLTYQYVLPTYDDIAYFLVQDQTNKYPYDFPDYLCSHFAMRLAGQFSIPDWGNLTFGLTWTNIHALNCVITEDMKFYFVEPQTDEIFEELKQGMGTSIRFIMI